jgi:uncharacterized damage-inducible protein DinB
VYTTVTDFAQTWKSEKDFTTKIFQALTDKSLQQSVDDGHRTLGRIAWHLTITIPEMMSLTGLTFKTLSKEAPLPGTARVIVSAYSAVAGELLTAVEQEWNDAALLTVDDMYGEKWQRGQTLDILIRHQVHHRGQMTVLMRQAGLIVPSTYGPAKEGWVDYGMQPPEV